LRIGISVAKRNVANADKHKNNNRNKTDSDACKASFKRTAFITPEFNARPKNWPACFHCVFESRRRLEFRQYFFSKIVSIFWTRIAVKKIVHSEWISIEGFSPSRSAKLLSRGKADESADAQFEQLGRSDPEAGDSGVLQNDRVILNQNRARQQVRLIARLQLVTRGNREVVNSVATNDGARFSDFGFLHMIKRSEADSILAEQLGLRKDIPRRIFQQLIAKASDDVRRKLEWERPDLLGQIQTSVTDVTGALQSKFGPASMSYFNAKKLVALRHQRGDLNQSSILEYARSRKFEETTVGVSLLCSLPVDVVERALLDSSREMILILAKALNFEWETTMSLLFLAAKDHRISALELDHMREEFARLNTETSRTVLSFYKSRKNASAADSEQRHLPQLHTH